MNRRQLLSSTTAVLGIAACSPALALSQRAVADATSRYVRNTLRWRAGQLHRVPDSSEAIGDYVVFACDGDSDIDLFVSAEAPEGLEAPTILKPLGRQIDLPAVYRSTKTHFNASIQ